MGCNFPKYFLLLFFSFCPYFLFAQTKETVCTYNAGLNTALPGVKIYDAKGAFMGKTDSFGKATILLKDFPVFFEKTGYVTLPVYDSRHLDTIYLRPFETRLKTVEIRGKRLKTKDYLLYLRDFNYPHYLHKDTVIYYKFNYILSFPDKNWQESAWGYIKLHRFRFIDTEVEKGIDNTKFSISLATSTPYFVQFHYQNTNDKFVHDKPFKKARPMLLQFILSNDFMSAEGYDMWYQLTRDYTFLDRLQPFSHAKLFGGRQWHFQLMPDKMKVFSATKGKDSKRLMEKIVFDSANRLQSVILFTPDFPCSFAGIKFMDNFSKGNRQINTFRTVYSYSKNEKNSLLTGINHVSTYYKKGVTFYRMAFKATLCDSVPESQFKLPLLSIKITDYSAHKHGYGVWQLIQKEGLTDKNAKTTP